MANFAVIDTETNWVDAVMSIGCCIADGDTFRCLEARYYILPEQTQIGGMYYDALFLDTPAAPRVCSRREAMEDLRQWLGQWGVCAIFAYNANFDRSHLPELRDFRWYDIMRLAAYRQYNPAIPASAEVYSTGRLKRGYGVESMLRLLRRDGSYRETHNALFDALDELELMRLLRHRPERYIPL